jgi:hypothetical protein
LNGFVSEVLGATSRISRMWRWKDRISLTGIRTIAGHALTQR